MTGKTKVANRHARHSRQDKSQDKLRDKARRQIRGKSDTASPQRLLYGVHAVLAALKNPDRDHKVVYATRDAIVRHDLDSHIASREIYKELTRDELSRMLPQDAVHQGLVLDAKPLPDLSFDDLKQCEKPIVILDQVSDPHNVGAVLRSCAAFGVGAVILQDRHSPEVTGALAKAACGAVESVSICRVVNIARAIRALSESNYYTIALDAEGDDIDNVLRQTPSLPWVLLLGAEGAGLRRLPRESCNAIARIPTAPAMPSLNISNAAAVALYALSQKI